VKYAIVVFSIPLRLLAIGEALLTGFGYLFFLSSQDTITTAYALATIFSLGYFGLSPRAHWIRHGNWLFVLTMSGLVAIAATGQLFKTGREFFENADAFLFLIFDMLLVIVMLVEAYFRSHNVGMFTSRPNPSINPDAAR
jgi:membrane-associated phospholipid phosphatase